MIAAESYEGSVAYSAGYDSGVEAVAGYDVYDAEDSECGDYDCGEDDDECVVDYWDGDSVE